MNQTTQIAFKILMPLLILTLSACRGGGSSPSNNNPTPNEELSDVLEDLGIDLTASKRVSDSGEDLPDNYAPLGSKAHVNQFSEIMLFGVPISDSNLSSGGNEMALTNIIPSANNSYN
ncbi:MAG: hypothetical protein GXP08_16945 [Gammaproteobacteria bacterium]|nr:hypothetical protein [Gammaproteobacteria bacterium]